MSAEVIDFSERLAAQTRRGVGVENLEFPSELEALGLESWNGRFVTWGPVQAAAIIRAAEVLREAFASPYEFDSRLLGKTSQILMSAGVDYAYPATTLEADHRRWSRLTPDQRAIVWLCSTDTERATIWGAAGIGGEVFLTRYGMIADVLEPDCGGEGPDHAA